MSELVVTKEFDFMGDTVIAVEQDGQWFFSPRRICENMGLDWKTQHRKIMNNKEKFNCGHMTTVGQDGKDREMIGIPVTHINTWMISINANRVKDPTKKAALEKYQNMLSSWLYEVGFLGAAVNPRVTALPVTQQKKIIAAAHERALLHPEIMSDFADKIKLIEDLPRIEGMEDYRANRIQMLADIKLGITHPLATRGVTHLTEELFYNTYILERWCVDKLICYFPKDLPSREAVLSYIQEKGYPSPQTPEAIHQTMANQLVKFYLIFRSSISDLIIYYNKSANQIHDAMSTVVKQMEVIFEQTRVVLPFPPIRDAQTMGARRGEYMRRAEWWDKRNAFFRVFNCCVDCSKVEVSSRDFEAHHLHYDTLGFESPWDLVPLCKACHAKREGK